MAFTKRTEYSDYLDYTKLRKIKLGPNIEVYTFEDEEDDEDEYVSWDCDGCYELGDFEFDTEWEEDDE